MTLKEILADLQKENPAWLDESNYNHLIRKVWEVMPDAPAESITRGARTLKNETPKGKHENLKPCTCKSKAYDKLFGKQMRPFKETEKGLACSICCKYSLF